MFSLASNAWLFALVSLWMALVGAVAVGHVPEYPRPRYQQKRQAATPGTSAGSSAPSATSQQSSPAQPSATDSLSSPSANSSPVQVSSPTASPSVSAPATTSAETTRGVSPVSSAVASSGGVVSSAVVPAVTTTDAQGRTVTSGGTVAAVSTAPSTETVPLVASRTHPVTSTVLVVTDGRTETSIATGTAVDVSTTGFATHTSNPQLNGDSNNGSSGLSDVAKGVIGGVVGGVGGLIVLGGLAYVAWRIWGRKRNAAQDDDYASVTPYNSGGATLTTEKRDSQGGSTTYANGLERYGERYGDNVGSGSHNVNTSSNF